MSEEDEKIVSLHGWPVSAPGEPIEGVVRVLKYMLGRAERGELVCVSIVGLDPSKTLIRAYDQGRVYIHELIGAVAVQQARLINNLEEHGVETDRLNDIPPAS